MVGTSPPGNKHQRKGDFPAKDWPGCSNSASRLSGEAAENKIVVKTHKSILQFSRSLFCAHSWLIPGCAEHLAAAFPTHSSIRCFGGFGVDISSGF